MIPLQCEAEDETLANIKAAIMTIIGVMREQGELAPNQPAEGNRPSLTASEGKQKYDGHISCLRAQRF
jgi:hypothetical protein